MDWERVMVNVGVVVGFLALMTFWLGLALWMRVDADKRGMIGWVWVWVGIVGGPVALFIYLIFRGTRPALPVVSKRDELIVATRATGLPSDYHPEESSTPEEVTPEEPPMSEEARAALEAEERRYRNL